MLNPGSSSPKWLNALPLNSFSIVVEEGHWERRHVPRNNPECSFKMTPWKSWYFIPIPDYIVLKRGREFIMNKRTYEAFKQEMESRRINPQRFNDNTFKTGMGLYL